METNPTNTFGWVFFLAKKYSGMFIEGTWITLYIAVVGTILGFILGFVIGVIQDSTETALNSSTDVIFTAAACKRAERLAAKK